MERIPLTRQLAAGATGGLASIAFAVFLRRVAGGVVVDLPPGETLVYTALYAFACLVIGPVLASSTPALRRACITPAAILILSLTFLAGLSAAPVTILAGTIVIVGLAGLSSVAEPARIGRGIPVATQRPDSDVIADAIDDDEHAGRGSERLVEPGTRIVRTGNAPHEQVEGTVRFETSPGETAATLHVPLWPPLTGSPSVTCVLEGVDGRVSVPYAKPHGFRIEVRLPEAVDEPLEGVVRFVARSSPSAAAA